MTTHSKETPLVSVVVPNYNYANYLVERIESVLNQTFTDFELILLDDASSDGSANVLERYRDNAHVACIDVNSRNTSSPFRQWQKGIGLAKGKYIWIAEADDLAEPNFLETCVKWAEKEPDVAVCYTGSLLIDPKGNVSRRDVNHWGRRTRNEAQCFDGKSFATHNLYWKNYIINASGVLFRREFALRVMDSDYKDMRYFGDWLFWFEMAMQGKVVEIYRNLNYFRQHDSKVTVTATRTGYGLVEAVRIIDRMEKLLPELKNYKRRLRRGQLYRKIKRAHLDTARVKELYGLMENVLRATPADYGIERRNQFLRIINPFLLTTKRDRL